MTISYRRTAFLLASLLLAAGSTTLWAQEQEQSRESMALDNTATQWSFQLAWQGMPEYFTDTMTNGVPICSP
jgi:hypothetical protein